MAKPAPSEVKKDQLKKLDPLFQKPKVELVPFERPTPFGWYTAAFPEIHDQNTILEIWLDETRSWINNEKIERWTFSFAHGLPVKKNGERLTPMFFFREEMDAYRFVWRFRGEVLKESDDKTFLVSVIVK